MSIRTKPKLFLGVTALAVLAAVVTILAVFVPRPPRGTSSESAFATRFQPIAPVIAGIGSTRALTPVPLEVQRPVPTNDRKPPPDGGAHHEPANASR
ncbi:hypothetical protein WKW79_35810 [Variovorax robiniae]|uniref:Sporulation protein n=1 Tax=Variovorax robiniae TaxID=1836199 RepID=A0ABU8XJB7_9BURK